MPKCLDTASDTFALQTPLWTGPALRDDLQPDPDLFPSLRDELQEKAKPDKTLSRT